jgi:hypothetical protein
MDSCDAFSHAISGDMDEQGVRQYQSYLNVQMGNMAGLGGWLGNQVKQTMNDFSNFVSSRAWEMSSRLFNKKDGDYVKAHEIGYLGSLEGLQSAQGLMRNYIMSHPEMMQLYQDDIIEGYGGELNKFCTGIGADNLYYRKAWDGVLNLQKVEDKNTLRTTHYNDSIGGSLSFRERVNVHKTYHAIDHHLAMREFDITSAEGKRRKDWVDPEDNK